MASGQPVPASEHPVEQDDHVDGCETLSERGKADDVCEQHGRCCESVRIYLLE